MCSAKHLSFISSLYSEQFFIVSPLFIISLHPHSLHIIKPHLISPNLPLLHFLFKSGPEVIPSYSSSAMSEAVVPDTMVSPAVGGLYGDKAGGPVVDFSYVGIDAILEQMRRKAMKQGFELNIMVVGK